MTDYIEREAAEKALDEACRYYPNSFFNGISVSADVIHKLPAADVRPVARGRWVQVMGKYDWMVKCSRCNGVPLETSNYCPNCGAEMVTGCNQLEEDDE